MKASLIGPDLRSQDAVSLYIVHLAQFLAQRGIEVHIHVPGVSMTVPGDVAPCLVVRGEGKSLTEALDPAESDVCVYCVPGSEPWFPEITRIQRAVVVFALHGPIRDEDSRWLPYADLCVAATPEIRANLAHRHGYAHERIYALSPEHPQYWEELARLVEQAATGVPEPAAERDACPPGPPVALRDPSRFPKLHVASKIVRDRADVAMRDYVARSRLPVIGPLVAWLRRNLTSHLREPYLDLIVEQQVAFNQEVSAWMEQTLEQLEQMNERLTRLEAALKRGGQQECDLSDRD
jgi:hypothetical protein